jgi:signal peptidase II
LSKVPLFWFMLTGFLALDQGVKAWVRGGMAVNQSLDAPWPGVFEIKRVTNEGIAFGMFQGMGLFLAPIAIAIAIFAIVYTHKHPRESGWTISAMALLAAGAVGNLYDRVFLGGVTDMFWFRPIDFPVFNIADACITGATIILIVKWGIEAFTHQEPAHVLATAGGESHGVDGPYPEAPTSTSTLADVREVGDTEPEAPEPDARYRTGGSPVDAFMSHSAPAREEEDLEGSSSEGPDSASTMSDLREVETSDPEAETRPPENKSSL